MSSTKSANPTLMSTELISKTIQFQPYGHYEWYQNEWLSVHEPFRREFIRAERSIKNMNITFNNWHIVNLNKWMNEYFLPCLFNHINLKIKIIMPYYENLGETFEYDKSNTLILLLNGIEEQIHELYNAVYDIHDINKVLQTDHIESKSKELHQSFTCFKDFCFNYMNQEVSIFLSYDIRNNVFVSKLLPVYE